MVYCIATIFSTRLAMALREADGNMRIQKGHFVYWMDSDKEIPRGDLGWVSLTRGYDGDIGVLFPAPWGSRWSEGKAQKIRKTKTEVNTQMAAAHQALNPKP